MHNKPRLLVISHVLPFVKSAGQNLRVFYTLKAASAHFHITFLTYTQPGFNEAKIKEGMSGLADETIVLPAVYTKSTLNRYVLKASGKLYTFLTGLKFSNFLIQYFEFSKSRISKAVASKKFDLVLYEYWHAYKSVGIFKSKGIPVILDTHNVLWQTYKRQYSSKLPYFVKNYHFNNYKRTEETAWLAYDGLITINKAEHEYIKETIGDKIKLIYMPMGVDISHWPYSWQPQDKKRLAFYGGLSTAHNQESAIFCAMAIMPLVWAKYPDCELWIIGSNPAKEIIDLQADKRIIVTGFVEQVNEVFKTLSIMLCPWKGTYGFRSRLIEVMSAGVPVISSPDAVYGMDIEENKGFYFANDAQEFASKIFMLLEDPSFLEQQSKMAHSQVLERFSFEKTYVEGLEEIINWLDKK